MRQVVKDDGPCVFGLLKNVKKERRYWFLRDRTLVDLRPYIYEGGLSLKLAGVLSPAVFLGYILGMYV